MTANSSVSPAAAAPAFIPLRLHTEYSISDGIIRIDDAVARAQAFGLPALAVTDLMNLFGMVKFYKACRSAGIKPIIGADILLRHPEGRTSRLLLLVKNHAGYLRLCELLTLAYVPDEGTERAATDKPAVPLQALATGDNSGLIALSGAALGEVGQYLLAGSAEEARAAAERWAACFPGAFYLELQRLPERPEWESMVSGSLKLAQALDLPVVATHPAQFPDAADFQAHEVRVCIAEGEVLADERRARDFTPSQYFAAPEEITARFADIPAALENTREIAKRCSLTVTLGKNYLPDFPTPNGQSLNDYLIESANAGLAERMALLYPDAAERQERYGDYQARLDFELDTIIKMGFPGYFLIVADFINWAKNNGCPVGPGRGSGAGSLVAYALKITDLDPLRYALLFERFLNPERVSMPDFDIDFCQENRWRVIEYVRRKYGAAAVSQIVTFGAMSSKAVIRDVGRVLQLPFGLCDRLSKLIPVEQNKPLSLDKALEADPAIAQLIAEEEAEELLDLARKLEDLTRGLGMHAGGVLIAPGKLTDFCPVYQAPGSDSPVSMYDKDDVEQIGLVKFDFLGLRNLTIIQMAQGFIKDVTGQDVDVAHIPLDDAPTYAEIFAKGNTTAVFQFESDGMKKMLEEARPTQFEEIIAFVALYRPGPMDLIPDFTRRMHGEPFQYLHPLLEDMLAPTYGIMVYQEQVMQAAQICAGYSLGGADLLRRAMGKKKPEEMAKQRTMFVEGAAQKGIDQAKANEIFDYMEKFAGYGFNKSHAAAYALVAYQTAWLKYHYPAEFMAATMSSELDNTDQLKVFVDDAKANGIEFLPPDVNTSHYRFTPLAGKKIRYALGAIKGTGEAAIEAVVKAREAGSDFTDLFDFCERVGRQALNKRTVEALVRAGAFDSIHRNRAELLANIELAIGYADQKAANANQGGLFDFDSAALPPVQMEPVAAWNSATELAEEKLALGFYYSASPFSPYAAEVRGLAPQPLAELRPDRDNLQRVAGFVTAIRTIVGKRGKFAVAALEDDTAKVEIRVADEVLEEAKAFLQADRILIFDCKVRSDDYSGEERLSLNAHKVYTLEEARLNFARQLRLQVAPGCDIEHLGRLLRTYRDFERTIPVLFQYRSSSVQGTLKPAAPWRVALKDELMCELQQVVGETGIQVMW